MGRGIERTPIFRNDDDRTDFVTRMAALCRDGQWGVYAWAFMPNHSHLVVRTGRPPLSQSMQQLLTGYVVNVNRRHKRYGHLFQNRYRSVICEEDPYLLELTRYIQLNPIRSGLVQGMGALRSYPWTGHSAILGRVNRDWQDTATVLAYFGHRRQDAAKHYAAFVSAGIPAGRRPELVGGGLVRSLGGWAQVLSLRRNPTEGEPGRGGCADSRERRLRRPTPGGRGPAREGDPAAGAEGRRPTDIGENA
jgi:REP element-mobilizing transposase RayT